MIWNVITLFPEALQNLCGFGVLGQAFEKNLLTLNLYNPRNLTLDKHKTVDDRPFGGGDGMVMQAEVLHQTLCLVHSDHPQARLIYLSPQGKRLDENLVSQLSKSPSLSLVCGRYGGVDQRVLSHWRMEEISIGDYVISGGEMAAGVLIDAVSRKIPGVLGHGASAFKDSHSEGWLEAPQFTRPRAWRGREVPEILLSGNHLKVQEWQRLVGILVSLQKRPDLWEIQRSQGQSQVDPKALLKFFNELSNRDRDVLGLDSVRVEATLKVWESSLWEKS